MRNEFTKEPPIFENNLRRLLLAVDRCAVASQDLFFFNTYGCCRKLNLSHRIILCEQQDTAAGAGNIQRERNQTGIRRSQQNGIGDWDLAFAYEALARAHAVAGDAARAREFTDRALAATEDITDDEDRDLVLADLETIPGQPRYW